MATKLKPRPQSVVTPLGDTSIDTGPFVAERLDEWAYWIVEREAVRIAKEAGVHPPWTIDPVIANNRFCSVRRMDDKVSKWMLENWFLPDGYSEPRTAVIAGLLARMVNKPETLSAITKGRRFTKWNYQQAYDAMYEIKNNGGVVFTNAYIINGASGGPKIDQVLNAIRDCYDASDKQASQFLVQESMQHTAERLNKLRGVGSFISGQVVADLRHVLGDVLDGWWADRMTWAPPGPGSSRGMKYLVGLTNAEDTSGRGSDMNDKVFLRYLRQLIAIAKAHPEVGKVFRSRKLEAHDIQNTLCETSKFIRVKHGAGRAKNKFDAMSSHARRASEPQLDL